MSRPVHHAAVLLSLAAACGGPEPLSIEGTGGTPPTATGPCEDRGGASQFLAPGASLAGAERWNCPLPATENQESERFVGARGAGAVVNGGSLALRLEVEGDADVSGRHVILGVRQERGYFLLPAPARGEDLLVPLDLFVSPTARSGDVTLALAIDDGTGAPGALSPGRYLDLRLEIIAVKGGDVQVNVNWDSPADVDLYVQDPGGEVIYWSAKTSSSGGVLDLDSNLACRPGTSNENIYWPEGGAPAGEYVVAVDLYDACGVPEPTSFRLTILLAGEVHAVVDGTLAQGQERQRGEVARFAWP